ncbi:hypothetical protein [Bradyrhizobium sp. Tv2a-2]|uniref:hypothetical protein n=1 Tax=Bradyrhizobium sp. Tv2a-2 TaxID=113395 RepID=UPI001FDAB542|nr:hypothetical protein [Bradyrhizobium sp. Tv2a-2]
MAYRAALMERTRERVPLQWAKSTAGLGVVCSLLAERTNDAQKAQTALSQIERALATARNNGDAELVAYCRQELRYARERLSNR